MARAPTCTSRSTCKRGAVARELGWVGECVASCGEEEMETLLLLIDGDGG